MMHVIFKNHAPRRLGALGIALVANLFAGCMGLGTIGGTVSQSSSSTQALALALPAQIATFTPFDLKVNNPQALSQATWSVTEVGDPFGGPAPGCSNLSAITATCDFQTVGTRTVRLTARDRNGNTLQFAGQVLVVDRMAGVLAGSVVVGELKEQGILLGRYSNRIDRVPPLANQDALTLKPNLAVYTLDLSRTFVESGTSRFRFDVQIPSISAQIFSNVGSQYALPPLPPGIAAIRINATNLTTNEQITVRIGVAVACTNAAGVQFSLRPSFSVSAVSGGTAFQSDYNVYRYDFSGIVQGAASASQLFYKVDFNGDTLYDTEWLPYTTPSVTDYSVYITPQGMSSARGPRNVRVMVWEKSCNIVQGVTSSLALPAPWAPGLRPAHHDFIQGSVIQTSASGGDLSSTSIDWHPAMNVDFLATRYRQATSPRYQCDFTDPAVLLIAGSTFYPSASPTPRPPHSLGLRIVNINDMTRQTPQGGTYTPPNARIQDASYVTDQMDDVLQRMSFIKPAASSCPLSMRISTTPVRTQGTCDVCTPSVLVDFISQIDGTYSCPNLAYANPALNLNRQVRIQDGAFSCEARFANTTVACPQFDPCDSSCSSAGTCGCQSYAATNPCECGNPCGTDGNGAACPAANTPACVGPTLPSPTPTATVVVPPPPPPPPPPPSNPPPPPPIFN